LLNMAAMPKTRHIANTVARTISQVLGGETGSGLLLIGVALAAVLAANSPLQDAYHHLFHATLAWTPVPKLTTAHLWINDALMAVFFFVVGLEIKREVLIGELSDAAKRRLPVLAAAAGMAAPALVYLLVTGSGAGNAVGQALQQGWAIPAATDIAFAVGVLALVGKRIPPSLRLFLLTVAIVDDLGAVTIIAVFFTPTLDMAWSIGALAFFAGLVAANRWRVASVPLFLALGLGLWVCVLYSGIHATIAGVLAAFTVPLRNDRRGDSMLLRLEHALTPWNSFVIVPLFGFANAGVALGGMGPGALLDPLPLAIALGLFVGKQAGIMAALFVSRSIGLAPLPAGASWLQLWGMAILCGIGFTMSLFIGPLAFPTHPLLAEEAKLGVIAGSLLSALLGYAVLRLAPVSRTAA
jgi:NhaA family Na+:H+ antiporter